MHYRDFLVKPVTALQIPTASSTGAVGELIGCSSLINVPARWTRPHSKLTKSLPCDFGSRKIEYNIVD
jgi:hypothetical protein